VRVIEAAPIPAAQCEAFLRWAAPHMRLRWRGYRRVRGQVYKRLRRRVAQLGLPDLLTYRELLEADPAEWQRLRALCVVTVSRFFRDAPVWTAIAEEVLPALATQADAPLRSWSLGCASGEEPYSLAILWELALSERFADRSPTILATDVHPPVLGRARVAEYSAATLREVPEAFIAQAFEPLPNGAYRVLPRFRALVELRLSDARGPLPAQRFDLVLCRNLPCTYFDTALQRAFFEQLTRCLTPGGAVVLGRGEVPPPDSLLAPWLPGSGIYRAPDRNGFAGPYSHGPPRANVPYPALPR